MFKCEQCPSTFTQKGNLTVHQKHHDGVRFPCTICESTFNYKTHQIRHMKKKHAITRVQPLLQRSGIEIASNIVVPVRAGSFLNQSQNLNSMLNEDFNDGYDDMCVEVPEKAQNSGLCHVTVIKIEDDDEPDNDYMTHKNEIIPVENRTVIEPVPSISQIIPVTKNNYLNGCPANQMGSTMTQSRTLINAAGHVVQTTPLVRAAVHTNTTPVIGNTVSYPNIVPRQYNMTTRSFLSLPSSPVPQTVQENYLCRNHEYELTRIPDCPFSNDESNHPAFKIQKARLRGRVIQYVIQCINAKAYIYSELMVTLNDLVQIALPKCTIATCAYVLTEYLNIKLYDGNSEQLALLRSNGRHLLVNPENTPLAMLQSINHVLPQLQTLVYENNEDIQQYQSGLFKGQKPNLECAGHGESRPGWLKPVAGSSSGGAAFSHASTTEFYSATEVKING